MFIGKLQFSVSLSHSYAILLWELATGDTPWMDLQNLLGKSHSVTSLNLKELAQHVTAGKRPPLPPGLPKELVVLLDKCWAQNPDTRPCIVNFVK